MDTMLSDIHNRITDFNTQQKRCEKLYKIRMLLIKRLLKAPTSALNNSLLFSASYIQMEPSTDI